MKSLITPGIASLGIVVIGLLLSGCDAFDSNGPHHVKDADHFARADFFFEVPVAQHERLRFASIDGRVEIVGDAHASSVTITGERRVGSETYRDAERHLDDLRVDVQDHGDEVFVSTSQPRESYGRAYVVDFTIKLPDDLNVKADHVNGNVRLRDTGADMTFSLINGEIDCYSTRAPEGDLVLNLVNGRIDLGIPKSISADFSATLVNGNIDVSNLVFANLTSTPSSMTGTLGGGDGSIVLSLVNGDIRVVGHN